MLELELADSLRWSQFQSGVSVCDPFLRKLVTPSKRNPSLRGGRSLFHQRWQKDPLILIVSHEIHWASALRTPDFGWDWSQNPPLLGSALKPPNSNFGEGRVLQSPFRPGQNKTRLWLRRVPEHPLDDAGGFRADFMVFICFAQLFCSFSTPFGRWESVLSRDGKTPKVDNTLFFQTPNMFWAHPFGQTMPAGFGCSSEITMIGLFAEQTGPKLGLLNCESLPGQLLTREGWRPSACFLVGFLLSGACGIVEVLSLETVLPTCWSVHGLSHLASPPNTSWSLLLTL